MVRRPTASIPYKLTSGSPPFPLQTFLFSPNNVDSKPIFLTKLLARKTCFCGSKANSLDTLQAHERKSFLFSPNNAANNPTSQNKLLARKTCFGGSKANNLDTLQAHERKSFLIPPNNAAKKPTFQHKLLASEDLPLRFGGQQPRYLTSSRAEVPPFPPNNAAKEPAFFLLFFSPPIFFFSAQSRTDELSEFPCEEEFSKQRISTRRRARR